MRDNKSLTHTRWNCKYHIVFATEIPTKNILWREASGNRENTARIVRMERCNDYRSRSMPGSYSHAGGDTTENECGQFYGVSQGKKQFDHT